MRPDTLTSTPDRFSDAAWDLLLATQDQARRWRHADMDVEHLLQVLLNDQRFAAWVDPLPWDPARLLDQLDDFCADQPTSSSRDLFVGEDLERLLEERRLASVVLAVVHLGRRVVEARERERRGRSTTSARAKAAVGMETRTTEERMGEWV